MIRDRSFYRTLFRISLPAAFQALVSFLVVVADDIMVSRLADATHVQAAVSQVNGITAFYTATLTGLVSGSSVLIAQYWGKKDLDAIQRIFAIVLRICLIVAIVFVLAARLAPNPILSLVIGKDEPAVLANALQYFTIVCFTWLPFAVTTALIGMLRAVEVVRIALIVSIVSLLMNVSLNWALIFGRIGFPALGVRGAAIATLITRIFEMVIVWVYAFHRQKVLQLTPRALLLSDRTLAKDYFRYGLPVGLTDMQWALIGMLKAAIIGHMGATFMAANNIASSMANLGTLFTFALAGGACVMVGKAVGAGDISLAKRYSNTIQLLFLGIGLIMSLIVFLLRTPFTRLYGSANDPEVFSLSTTLIAVLAVTLIGTSYHASCFVGINRGAGDTRFVAIVDSICGWLIVLPCTFLTAFVFKLSLPIVFLSTRIDQCFKWLIAFLRLRTNKWIQNVTRDEIST
ncbi:MAG: MATE family efflux transporter [Clostridia bacterium]|nr:MATE family efflux transporter [Clostridia bacterium]